MRHNAVRRPALPPPVDAVVAVDGVDDHEGGGPLEWTEEEAPLAAHSGSDSDGSIRQYIMVDTCSVRCSGVDIAQRLTLLHSVHVRVPFTLCRSQAATRQR